MRLKLRLYALEVEVVLAGLAVSIGVYITFHDLLGLAKEELVYVSVANAGMLFIVGHVYSRLKDRRESKRNRAQQLFLEWHSKEMRESRIFASRWVEVNGKAALPALGALEKEAAEAYRRKIFTPAPVVTVASPSGVSSDPKSLDDPELKEFHFFKIYQFFERWAKLIQNKDIYHFVASKYMSSYKKYYIKNFLEPWEHRE